MKKYSVEEAIDLGNKVTGVISALASAAVAFTIGVIFVKLLWTWTIPDLFPAAVAQGLITGHLPWLTTIKAVALVAIVSGTGALIVRPWGR